MKYKNINTMLHNFGHSFCSDMNMIIKHEEFCGFIFQKLNKFFRSNPEKSVQINFSTGEVIPMEIATSEFLASIDIYRTWLRDHCTNHQIQLDRLDEVKLVFKSATTTSGKSFGCEASCVDDRGKSYTSRVNLKDA